MDTPAEGDGTDVDKYPEEDSSPSSPQSAEIEAAPRRPRRVAKDKAENAHGKTDKDGKGQAGVSLALEVCTIVGCYYIFFVTFMRGAVFCSTTSMRFHDLYVRSILI